MSRNVRRTCYHLSELDSSYDLRAPQTPMTVVLFLSSGDLLRLSIASDSDTDGGSRSAFALERNRTSNVATAVVQAFARWANGTGENVIVFAL